MFELRPIVMDLSFTVKYKFVLVNASEISQRKEMSERLEKYEK